MNTQPRKNDSPSDRSTVRDWFKHAPRRFWKVLRYQLALKILALFLALALWVGLIMQDPTLTRQISFYDVPVSISGEELLRKNGLTVSSGLSDDVLTVDFKADVPQSYYTTAYAGAYNARIDLSRITEEGEQMVSILTSTLSTYGSVVQIEPSSISVVVEPYVTNYRVPVSVNVIGDYPSGFYGKTPTLDPSTVTVSGAESVVDSIARIYVDYDVSKLTAKAGEVITAVSMRVVDDEGNTIPSDSLEITSSSVLLRTINVKQTLYATKTVNVTNNILTEGVPAQGYEVKSITASPSTLMIAGDDVALQALDVLFLEEVIDVTDCDESFMVDVQVETPGTLAYMSANKITLTVEIAPIVQTRVIEDVPVEVIGTEQSYLLSNSAVAVTVTGPQNQVENLDKTSIMLYVDAEEITSGVHELPLQVQTKDDTMSDCSLKLSADTVTITIEAQ